VAGTGFDGGSQGRETDGVQATSSTISLPTAVAVGPDGSFYIADAQHCIRRVTPDGIIRTFAGQCYTFGFSGDGGPATSALLHSPNDIAFGPDGSLYIADTYNQRIRRVFPNGIIQTVAGSGPVGSSAGGFSGDGGPAVQAVFHQPWGVDVAPDGTFYIVDLLNLRVRRVGPDGVVTTVAGDGTGLTLNPSRVRVAPDGSFYVVENSLNDVRKVGSDGIIRPFAGQRSAQAGYGGDGGSAKAALLNFPIDAAVGPDGSVYIGDQNDTVRRVAPDGTITTVAGIAGSPNVFSGDNGLAAAATLGIVDAVRVGPDGSLYMACDTAARIRRVQFGLTGSSLPSGTVGFPSKDGRQIYVFDSGGRHQQTLDAFTQAVLYQFTYDAAGRLSAVTDVDNNLTQINHDPSGNLASIVGPFNELRRSRSRMSRRLRSSTIRMAASRLRRRVRTSGHRATTPKATSHRRATRSTTPSRT